ncbi:MAG: FprA family A-type flavoprotein [Myxococcota bacterium]|jgi:flavorubredoxin
MKPVKMNEGIDWVGIVDWDRRLFDALIPLPDGTSYNSWIVRGSKKNALIDTVDPAFADRWCEDLLVTGTRIDYVVMNHAEQDHSGTIPRVLGMYPDAKLLTSEKGRGLAIDMLAVPEDRISVVKDGETVSLGDRTLQFIYFPWVHWPETMLTWVPELGTLLSGDLFGAHLCQSDLFVSDDAALRLSAKRYFAEIMLPFRAIIEKNLPKVAALDLRYIGPSHGPAHNRPSLIIDAYREWLSPEPKNLVLLPFVSMHDSTRIMVNRLVESLAALGVRVERFDLADTDTGKLAMALVDAATIVLATPTVLGGAHPRAAYAAFLANALRPKAKFISVMGSYGWGGKAVEQLVSMMPNIKAEVIEPLLVKGLPREADLQKVDALASAIASRHATMERT